MPSTFLPRRASYTCVFDVHLRIYQALRINQLSLSCMAAIAQLGERQTEDLKVPGSIPGLGNLLLDYNLIAFHFEAC